MRKLLLAVCLTLLCGCSSLGSADRGALELDRAGRGIAMSLSIASVGGPSTLQILSGKGGANAHDTAL